MNPLFQAANTMNKMGNTVGNIKNMVSQYKQLQKNPSSIGKLLLDNGRITQAQYEEIGKYNGNASQIGNYLMNNGVMNQNMYNQLSSNANQFRQYL